MKEKVLIEMAYSLLGECFVSISGDSFSLCARS
jgi:hypothetical protein